MEVNRKIAKELCKFDPRCFYFFDLEEKRWIVLRMPEKYGTIPKNLGNWEVKQYLSAGKLVRAALLETPDGQYAEPGSWVISYLQQKDGRRINVKHFLRELDERNAKLQQKLDDDAADRRQYRIKEDFMHLKDEMQGEKLFRKYTITSGIDLKTNGSTDRPTN